MTGAAAGTGSGFWYAHQRPSLTADAVVRAPDGAGGWLILLVLRAHPPFAGCWALPGGHVNPHEQIADAAVRETAEETGVVIPRSAVSELRVFDESGRDPRGWTVTTAYIATLDAPAATTADDDAAEAAWWPLESLPPLAFDHAAIIACARVRWGTGGLPIVYREAPDDSGASAAGLAAEHGLGERRWCLLRALEGRSVWRGDLVPGAPDPASGVGRGPVIFKIGHDAYNARRFARAMAGAHRLDALGSTGLLPAWIAAPDAEHWDLRSAPGVTTLACPLQDGAELAPERPLSADEAAALTAAAVAVVPPLLAAFDALPVPAGTAHSDPAFFGPRLASRLDALEAAGTPLPASPAEFLALLAQAMAGARHQPRFGHGELTPWHILRDGDRVRLIDLEGVGANLRHSDLAVFVQRTAVLCQAPAAAAAVIAAVIASLPPEDAAAFWTDTAWMWLYGGVRTLQESAYWAASPLPERYLRWCLDVARGLSGQAAVAALAGIGD